MADPTYPGWAELLQQAIEQPGRLHDGYRAFHAYSMGNQQLALAQCIFRHIAPGPIATVKKWNERGRRVRKGQRAIVLCRPILITKQAEEGEEPETFLRFTYRPHWFAFSQTEADPEYTGPVYEQEPPPMWELVRAYRMLGVREIPFESLNGNTQGYSFPETRELAISPLAKFPWKTGFHELGHILLNHSHDGDKPAQEVEAELTAYLLTRTLEVDVDGGESSRAYAQSYLGGATLTDATAQRIYRVANRILEAGYAIKREEVAA